jgi:hypothetical protein
MTSVPENWIPFVPVRFDKNGQMRLRRAALPRTLADRPPVRIRPRTQLLREGLESPQAQPFDLNEEEITMPGILVRQCWRQARWFDGKIFTWLARGEDVCAPGSGLRVAGSIRQQSRKKHRPKPYPFKSIVTWHGQPAILYSSIVCGTQIESEWSWRIERQEVMAFREAGPREGW